MKQYYTYLHCKPDGTPFYVGKGSGRRSKYFGVQRSEHHRNIVAKYGKENILIYIFPCDSEAQALADEMQQIRQLRADGYDLINISIGGESGATGAHWTLSEETKAKQGAAKIGNKNGLFGKSRTGKINTEEHRAKLSAAAKLQWANPEKRPNRNR